MLLISHLPKVDFGARASIVLPTGLTVTERADAALTIYVNCLLGRARLTLVSVQIHIFTVSINWMSH